MAEALAALVGAMATARQGLHCNGVVQPYSSGRLPHDPAWQLMADAVAQACIRS